MVDNVSPLPNGWISCTLGDVLGFGVSGQFRFAEIDPDAWILELEDIERDSSVLLKRVRANQRQPRSILNRFMPGDILYGKLRPTLNKVVVADEGGYCTTEILPLTAPDGVDPRFVMYWLKHSSFRSYAERSSHGLSMPRLGTAAARSAPFVLPPPEEQTRIADRLEDAAGRARAATSRLESARDLVPTARHDLLSSALAGDLTADWRGQASPERQMENPELPEGYQRLTKRPVEPAPLAIAAPPLPPGWLLVSLSELYDRNVLIDYADGNHGSKYPRKIDFTSDQMDVPFLTARDLDDRGGLSIEGASRLRRSKATTLVKGWTQNGDLLLTHNATVGRVAVVKDLTEKALLGTSVTFYRFNPDYFDPQYAWVAFSSPFFQAQLAAVMGQTTRNQVPLSRQAALYVLWPPLLEQRQIALLVNTELDRLTALSSAIDAAYLRIGRIVEELLDQAFRGELVDQLPTDSSAEILLQAIVTAPRKTRPRRRTRGTGGKPMKVGGEPGHAPDALTLILREFGPMSSEELWRRSDLEIDSYFAQLRKEEAAAILRVSSVLQPDGTRKIEQVE